MANGSNLRLIGKGHAPLGEQLALAGDQIGEFARLLGEGQRPVEQLGRDARLLRFEPCHLGRAFIHRRAHLHLIQP